MINSHGSFKSPKDRVVGHENGQTSWLNRGFLIILVTDDCNLGVEGVDPKEKRKIQKKKQS